MCVHTVLDIIELTWILNCKYSTAVFVSWARAYFSDETAQGKKDVHDKWDHVVLWLCQSSSFLVAVLYQQLISVSTLAKEAW